ncbi:hypothetical protein CALVIDRAFT_336310 [Calocera viscosa TUFC12733]|uniref:Uncharacterized protein n=1 Tax=Calocera viscosa (strain TUFC12733) TaxID=1330018 RepID=A0A167HNL1_CALVF|nr:hypothetical protein CALVIDRAFT_336310 [Calocera viscosa TUFC12733]
MEQDIPFVRRSAKGRYEEYVLHDADARARVPQSCAAPRRLPSGDSSQPCLRYWHAAEQVRRQDPLETYVPDADAWVDQAQADARPRQGGWLRPIRGRRVQYRTIEHAHNSLHLSLTASNFRGRVSNRSRVRLQREGLYRNLRTNPVGRSNQRKNETRFGLRSNRGLQTNDDEPPQSTD